MAGRTGNAVASQSDSQPTQRGSLAQKPCSNEPPQTQHRQAARSAAARPPKATRTSTGRKANSGGYRRYKGSDTASTTGPSAAHEPKNTHVAIWNRDRVASTSSKLLGDRARASPPSLSKRTASVPTSSKRRGGCDETRATCRKQSLSLPIPQPPYPNSASGGSRLSRPCKKSRRTNSRPVSSLVELTFTVRGGPQGMLLIASWESFDVSPAVLVSLCLQKCFPSIQVGNRSFA